MLVFITHPKYFEKKSLYRKKPELIYIFNSPTLYKEVSKKYKCVNLDKNYNIKNENFFPPANDKKRFKHNLIVIKKQIYAYFKKKQHKLMQRNYILRTGYKDVTYKLTMELADKYEKKDKQKAILFLENEIFNLLMNIIKMEKDEKFTETYKIHIATIFNLMNSFYRAYIYSFCEIRGSEVYGDVFKFNNFLDAILYYTFDKYDLFKDDFNYPYKKVLCRLFIEKIHKNNIKKFVKRNIEYQRSEGWL
jgi:hypothetical protein